MTTSVQSPSIAETVLCPSCGTELLGEYCHQCGEKMFHEQDLALKHFFLHSLHEFTHLDSKIFATLRYLFTRPGFLTREYVAGRRLHYVKPLSVFLAACAVFFLVDSVRPIDRYNLSRLTKSDRKGQMSAAWEPIASYRRVTKEKIAEEVEAIVHKLNTSAQLTNALAMAVVLALFYRRRYFTEHLVFACHFLAFNFLGLLLLSPLESAAGHLKIRLFWVTLVQTAVFIPYLFFALRRVYAEGAGITVLKAVGAYTVTQLLMFGTMVTTLVIAVVFSMLS